MYAVIMAGGKGSRLRTLTRDKLPKPLVPVCGKPILQWQIECLRRSGIRDICIVTGYLGEKIHEMFGDGSRLGVNITYFDEKTPLGTAGALPFLKPFIGDESFLLVFGDCIFDVDIERMISFHKQRASIITIFVHPNSHPKDSDLIILDENGCVTDFVSKSAPREKWFENMVNAGLYILPGSICSELPAGIPWDLERDYLFHKIPLGKVWGYRSTEYIKDAGTPERILQITADIKAGIVASRNLKNRQKCIFLDRDGTINIDKSLIHHTEDFELLPNVADAIKKINRSGYLAVVVTNQSVVARGLCTMEMVDEIHRKMQTLLGEEGAYLDAVYYCPHHPDKGFPEENPAYKMFCSCRKPEIGMLVKAAEQFNISLKSSWIVGDTTRDIMTGKNAGLKTILVQTGKSGHDGNFDVKPDAVCGNLSCSIDYILKR